MSRYIDADKLEKYIADGLNNPNKKEAFGFDAVQILSEIYVSPSANVQEVKHGKWIKYSVDITEHPLHCSLCGWSNYRISNREVIDFGFCPNPNCGARMDGDEK